jgi:hypothetical protein
LRAEFQGSNCFALDPADAASMAEVMPVPEGRRTPSPDLLVIGTAEPVGWHKRSAWCDARTSKLHQRDVGNGPDSSIRPDTPWRRCQSWCTLLPQQAVRARRSSAIDGRSS